MNLKIGDYVELQPDERYTKSWYYVRGIVTRVLNDENIFIKLCYIPNSIGFKKGDTTNIGGNVKKIIVTMPEYLKDV